MFVSEAVVNPSKTPQRCFTLRQAPCLPHKHDTKLETARNKCSSLLRTTFIHYTSKSSLMGPRANVFILFCSLFTNFRSKLVFIRGKLFHPSLMFVGKTSALPKREASLRCSIREGCVFIANIRLDWKQRRTNNLAYYKHS